MGRSLVFRKNTPRGDRAGCIYVFVRSGESWSQQLMAEGSAVTLSNDTILAGAPYDKTGINEKAGLRVHTERGHMEAAGQAQGDRRSEGGSFWDRGGLGRRWNTYALPVFSRLVVS